MNFYQLPKRMEIAFWTTAISLMNTSPHVRFALRKAYPLLIELKRTPLVYLVLAWTAIGLVLGFSLSLWVFFTP
jgi:hypothetical protein